MVKVLFVCLGNICRSPMAEALFRHLVQQEGLEEQVLIDSAGTGNWHIGKPPHQGTRKILEENNISYAGMTARQIEAEDLDTFDYIVAMDQENVGAIQQLNKRNKKIIKLLDFSPDQELNDVPDPYYTGNFSFVYQLVEQACQELLQEIKKKHF